jgi:1-deoxy-D-xylulose-5-phosphate synthase
LRPVAGIYRTVVQRAIVQVVHVVCIQNLPVLLALDRGGKVGDDGRTHQGVFDISYLRPIPNMVLMAPKDENELQHMVYTGLQHDGPSAVRYPRGNGLGVEMDAELKALPIGKAEVLRRGSDVAIVAYGATVPAAVKAAELLAAEGIEAAVINARFAKPLDEELLAGLATTYGRILTVEENVEAGGFGAAVLEFYANRAADAPRVKVVGLPDHFIDHGPQAYRRDQFNLSAEGLVREVKTGFPELRLVRLPARAASE